MIPFDFQPRTRIVFGPGKIGELGVLAKECGGSRALLFSDPGVVAAGHSERGLESLREAGLETRLVSDIHQNPSTRDVAAGLAIAQEFQPDLLVGLGGGSAMDCAKGVNFVYTNGGCMQDYWGVEKATSPMLPMLAVPTTAGTGSETQSFALISDENTHIKMACGDKKAACRVAILDPELTLTQPRQVTALTGIDAIAHAVETFVTTRRTAISMAFSREAWRLLATNFARVLAAPDDLEARGGMQLGASFAGMAIENSMLGAAHALANPLTAAFNIVHGQAVGLMLPHVVRFNGAKVHSLYVDLLNATAGESGLPDARNGADGLADFLAEQLERAGFFTKLVQCGAPRERLPELAAAAAKQWTGQFNPRTATVDDFLAMYEAAF